MSGCQNDQVKFPIGRGEGVPAKISKAEFGVGVMSRVVELIKIHRAAKFEPYKFFTRGARDRRNLQIHGESGEMSQLRLTLSRARNIQIGSSKQFWIEDMELQYSFR